MTAIGMWMVLACVLWVSAASARAEEGAETPIKPFALLEWGGELFVKGRVHRDRETSGGVSTREDELAVQEGIETRAAGFIYHPNLLAWRLVLRLGAEQEQITTNQRGFRTNSRLLGYDFSGLWLKEKKVSVRTFAGRTQDLRDRDFARSATFDEDRYGAELLWRGPYPGSLLAERIVSSEKGDLRDEDEDAGHVRLSLSNASGADWQTQLTYDRWDRNRTASYWGTSTGPATEQDLSETSDELVLTDLWRFGSDEQEEGRRPSMLSGRTRILDRRGFYCNRVMSIDQRLELAHTKTFSTFYALEYTRDQTDSDDDRTTRGQLGFHKSIYESLDLNGTATITRFRFLGGQEDRAGASLTAAYRKQTAIGQYTCSLLLGLDRDREQSGAGLRFFRNEAVTLTGLGYVTLSRPGIDIGTVVVTNATRTRTYVAPDDYVIRRTGARVEIARVAAGEILDGQVVLVDYAARISRDATYDTRRVRWTHRLRLKKIPIAPYADFRVNDEVLRSGEDPGNLERERTARFGAELDWKGLVAAIEHETRRQVLSPSSVADRVRADYHRALGRDVELTAGGAAERLEYTDGGRGGLAPEDRRLDSVSARLGLNAKLGAHAVLGLASSYTRLSGRDNNALFRNTATLQWQYGKLDVSVEAHADTYAQGQTKGNSAGLMFYLKRAF